MPTHVRSHSKINLGLAIGPVRADGFHGLATLYQTLALYDVVTISARRLWAGGESTIRLTTNHPRVPTDARNTAWKMVERTLARLGIAAEVAIHIQKELPVQGGMGAGSANAAAALLGLERELGVGLPEAERMEVAAEVGSDVPLFLVGGAVLGMWRGERVLPAVPDLPPIACVVAIPGVGVSTPRAFRDWDALEAGLTCEAQLGRLEELSHAYASIFDSPTADVLVTANKTKAEHDPSGIVRGLAGETKLAHGSTLNGLAEDPLLALVRTGIENDFEQVVFSQYPLLREIKHELMGIGSSSPALYAALSGSGSALFGLYRSTAEAAAAQQRVQASGCKALLTETLPRAEYWRKMFAE
jgi:4-diphosphocytidyl-2-C-methyl-D-erythritol kinase